MGLLDDFLMRTKVFPSYARADTPRVLSFLDALERAGFRVFREPDITAGLDWADTIKTAITDTARDGWIVVFLSPTALASQYISHEVSMAHQLGGRFIPVALDPVTPGALHAGLGTTQIFDAYSNPAGAPPALVDELLRRQV